MGIQMCFPGGRPKAFTLSYDDGVKQDVRLIEIMKRYGIKGAFNINSGRFSDRTFEGWMMPYDEMRAAYDCENVEIAVHSYTHPTMTEMPTYLNVYEIVKDREFIEQNFGKITRGMAYPNGLVNAAMARTAAECGIAYARTIKSTRTFDIPTDWLLLDPTCHHNDEKLFELADKFVNDAPRRQNEMPSWLFYVWGHSYEFDNDGNWDRIEKLLSLVGGRDDVWYATNIEIYDYTMAYKSLVYSLDQKMVHNPSATDVWIYKNPNIVKIPSGQTVYL